MCSLPRIRQSSGLLHAQEALGAAIRPAGLGQITPHMRNQMTANAASRKSTRVCIVMHAVVGARRCSWLAARENPTQPRQRAGNPHPGSGEGV